MTVAALAERRRWEHKGAVDNMRLERGPAVEARGCSHYCGGGMWD